MGFQISEQHIHDYYHNGVTVFEKILPPSLISDLRRVTDKGRELVRAQKGGQVQRFQPISAYEIDQQPFRDYAELPELRAVIDRVLSPQHEWGNVDFLGVLIEPDTLPYCTNWHRDARSFLDDDEWQHYIHRWDIGNQVNCPLYEDSCTWIVPGSHLRFDLESETKFTTVPDLKDKSNEERERLCLEYCQNMPRAERLLLNAGDFALYRSRAWHLGNYIPGKKRATLHDAVAIPQAQQDWMRRMKEGKPANLKSR